MATCIHTPYIFVSKNVLETTTCLVQRSRHCVMPYRYITPPPPPVDQEMIDVTSRSGKCTRRPERVMRVGEDGRGGGGGNSVDGVRSGAEASGVDSKYAGLSLSIETVSRRPL